MSKIVVVTGAGTGVGRRVAEVLSKEDMVVYLIGRRKDKLIAVSYTHLTLPTKA